MARSVGRRGRPNIVGIDKGIGPREAQLMRVIVEMPAPVTVREVCDRLSEGGYFAYQSVLNCMNRLVKKGILKRTEGAGAFLFTPCIELDQLAAQVVTNVLGHMGGNLDRVICHVLKVDPDLGEETIAELRQRARAVSRAARKG
jgi:predicted transcriptional regulator